MLQVAGYGAAIAECGVHTLNPAFRISRPEFRLRLSNLSFIVCPLSAGRCGALRLDRRSTGKRARKWRLRCGLAEVPSNRNQNLPIISHRHPN